MEGEWIEVNGKIVTEIVSQFFLGDETIVDVSTMLLSQHLERIHFYIANAGLLSQEKHQVEFSIQLHPSPTDSVTKTVGKKQYTAFVLDDADWSWMLMPLSLSPAIGRQAVVQQNILA